MAQDTFTKNELLEGLPIEQDTKRSMVSIAEYIEGHVGTGKYGFAVLIFPFGEEPRVGGYISNASRKDMIVALREKADILERGTDIKTANSDQVN